METEKINRHAGKKKETCQIVVAQEKRKKRKKKKEKKKFNIEKIEYVLLISSLI